MSKRIFNLLKPEQPIQTVWDKIYDWLLNRARIVIMITLLLVAAAFFGKVIEDTIAKNKDKEIANLQAELAFFAIEKEPTFREIQIKDGQYLNIWTHSSDLDPILVEVYSYIPNTAAELSVKIDKESVTIFGTEDLEILKQLESSIKNSPTFTNAYIGSLNVEESASGSVQSKGSYSLNAKIKKSTREAY